MSETIISRRRALATIGGATVALALAPALLVLAEPDSLPLRTLDGREVQVVRPHMEDNDVAAVFIVSDRADGIRLLGINAATIRDAAAERAVLSWARQRIAEGKRAAFVFAHELDA